MHRSVGVLNQTDRKTSSMPRIRAYMNMCLRVHMCVCVPLAGGARSEVVLVVNTTCPPSIEADGL